MHDARVLSADRVSALLLGSLGVYVLSVAPSWGLWDLVGPGPGFFPTVYGALMLAFSLALLGRSFRTARGQAAVDPPGERGSTFAALAAWAALALSIPLMRLLGFTAGFGLLAFFLVRAIFGKPLATSLVTAACISVGLYLLFEVGLELELPASALFRGR